MGDNTAIEWTDATWNPIIGCSRVGPGCDHCYAIGVVHRQMSPQHVGLTIRKNGATDWTGEVRPWAPMLGQPLRWKRPRRIFVNSLSDLFHADLPDEEIAKVFAVMALAPQHTFQVLTKRSKRMRDLAGTPEFRRAVRGAMTDLAPSEKYLDDLPLIRWPLPNVWLGVSVENDSYVFRADHLRATPAAVRWISAEPLLGPLSSLDLSGIDWVVAGGESGPGARPMHPEWVRDLRDRCTDDRGFCDDGLGDDCCPHLGTRFLFKQWGAWAPTGRVGIGSVDLGRNIVVPLGDGDGCGEELVRVGKKAAGRELDGRTWDEYPGTA